MDSLCFTVEFNHSALPEINKLEGANCFHSVINKSDWRGKTHELNHEVARGRK